MANTTDEEIIYKALVTYGGQFINRMNKKPSMRLTRSNAQSQLQIVQDNSTKLEYYLKDDDAPMAVMQKKMKSAKGTYIQFLQIKGSFPELVSNPLASRIDKILHHLAAREADCFDTFRRQEVGGELYDLSDTFASNANINRLCSMSVRDIVKNYTDTDAKDKSSTQVGNINDQFYITDTGAKYHVKDCPYCKRFTLYEATTQKISGLKLTPCRCVEAYKVKRHFDWTHYVTVFIDESIHHTIWNEVGKEGKQGNFSYIICRGMLESENDITSENTIYSGVDYIRETHSPDRITRAAIGTVLMYLAYDCQFDGTVQVYTDNMSAMNVWSNNRKNAKLASLFEGVKVSHIPRECNKRADALGHTRVLIDVPSATYSRIVDQHTRYNELEAQFNIQRKALEESRTLLEEALNREKEPALTKLHNWIKGIISNWLSKINNVRWTSTEQ